MSRAPTAFVPQLRGLLGAFLFSGDAVEKRISVLSGGEKARVRLAQLLMDNPNVLVMDEPTNHLDIAACEALERTLGDFPGTILCVSHDRYFLDRVVTRLLVLEPPAVVDFDGNYSQWHERCVQNAAAEAHAQAQAKVQAEAKARQAKKSAARR